MYRRRISKRKSKRLYFKGKQSHGLNSVRSSPIVRGGFRM